MGPDESPSSLDFWETLRDVYCRHMAGGAMDHTYWQVRSWIEEDIDTRRPIFNDWVGLPMRGHPIDRGRYFISV